MRQVWWMSAVFVAILGSPLLASAQEPYSPIKPSKTKLVTNGRFQTSPLKLPFKQINVSTVAEGAAVNFEHIYAMSSQEVLAYFQDQTNNPDGFELFDATVYPVGANLRFKLIGSQARREGGFELRFASPNSSRDFRIQVYDRGGNAAVKLINLVLTNPTSGVGPAREGFHPIGLTQELPFRWN